MGRLTARKSAELDAVLHEQQIRIRKRLGWAMARIVQARSRHIPDVALDIRGQVKGYGGKSHLGSERE